MYLGGSVAMDPCIAICEGHQGKHCSLPDLSLSHTLTHTDTYTRMTQSNIHTPINANTQETN